MFSSLALSAVPLLLAGLQAVTVDAVPTISAVGSKFFYENGTQYYLKGSWGSGPLMAGPRLTKPWQALLIS
jgi:hypothetical protein